MTIEMTTTNKKRFETTEDFANKLDLDDTLKVYRKEFHIPPGPDGRDSIYLSGNSLGLQPKKAQTYVIDELSDWAKLGVEGHLHARTPWLSYHETLTTQTARLVGALPHEVVVMNTLTVNLHLMMVSFYRPSHGRFKILVEGSAFPSDQYAVASQVRYRGWDPKEAIIELYPRPGESLLREEDILKKIEQEGSSIALVLLGNVNYLTGQAFSISEITRIAHAQGCYVGFDLAHGAGNLSLNLHEDGPDFALWCSYKYLNGGPGSLGGCFIHERHANNSEIPRFCGWWGHNKKTRFQMGPVFDPIAGAEGWQLSNPPILQLAVLRASMEIFDRATMPAIRKKSETLTNYLEFLLDTLTVGMCNILTPKNTQERGAQLSLQVKGNPQSILDRLEKRGVIGDFREPNIIRVAPIALYNSYSDVFQFVNLLKEELTL